MDKSGNHHSDTTLEQDLRKILLQNNEYVKQITYLKDKNHDLKIELNNSNNQIKILTNEKETIHQRRLLCQTQVERLERVVFNLRRSSSFRLGQVVVNGLASPGKNTLLMPFRFCKVIFEIVVQRLEGREKKVSKNISKEVG